MSDRQVESPNEAMTAAYEQTISNYWGRSGLGQAILDALKASGKHLEALTLDDLAPLDQFHGGGKAATQRLAHLAALSPGTQVLDAGGGLGGPARTLAVEFGCHVTVLDLTEPYVQAGEFLTAHLGLSDRVAHQTGSALALPFPESSFDVVWTQNSGMNIADKARLYAGFHRVLKPGGRLAFQEPMAGPVQPPIFPVMWARDAASHFLHTPTEMRELIESAGFRPSAWDDVTMEDLQSSTPDPAYSIQRLIMGDDLLAIRDAGRRNRDEGRIVMVHAVFDRPAPTQP